MRLLYEVYFSPIAKKEFDESIEWYENALLGLGEEFVFEVERIIKLLERRPRLFPIKKYNLREVPLKRFPYLIVYRINKHTVTIASVFHTSRNSKKKYRK